MKIVLYISSMLISISLFGFISVNENTGQSSEVEIKVKVDSLLSIMTLDEKIGQMTQVDYLAFKDFNDIKKYFIGSVLWGGNSEIDDISSKGWSKTADELQKYSAQTRLKIPLLLGIDAVHGHNNVSDAVIFPHNIALGCTRNPELVEKAARVTAEEVAGTGINWTFAPCVAVARNDRWGRTYESFGEDPELVAEMGSAAVKGFEGILSNKDAILSCTKHFIGDGGTTNGKDQGNTECDEGTLKEIHLPGYIAAIKAGTNSIMVSYSSWNGIKMHGNKYLVTDLLKNELGFKGLVVSDWAAIDQLGSDFKKDIEKSINAGLDMIMIPNGKGQKNNYTEFVSDLKELVNDGKVSQERIDDAVRRILSVKLKMDIFNKTSTDKELLSQIGSEEHREVARECVRQSLVLLKNENHILPLSKKASKIFIAGKGADSIGIQCGGWTISWQGSTDQKNLEGTTILQAVKNSVDDETKIIYSKNGNGAEGSDFAVVVIGEKPYAEMIGDRTDLSLSSEDIETINNVKKSGVPVVLVLLSGRPLIIDKALDMADAFVAAWLPGTEGEGVTDVLFGDYSPTGKLSQTWPKTMSQEPINIGDKNYDPLFPFGFGLTY